MNKEQVLEKLNLYYEEEMRENQFYQQNKENQDLIIKLMQTTDLFVRSFDYDMPVGHTLKAKLANFIRRVIRRCTRFITKPYADKMQRYNESVCELLGEMIKQNGDKMYSIRQQMEVQQKKLDEECEKMRHGLENNHDEMVQRMYSIEINNNQAIDDFEKKLDEQRAHLNPLLFHIDDFEKKLDEQRAHLNPLLFHIDDFEKKLDEQRGMIEGVRGVLNDTVNKTLEMGGQLTVLCHGTGLDDENAEWMSYSQAGEDKIVQFLMNYGDRKLNDVSYLDIGCNHYKNLNNTYSFYQKGYRGVLVEANPNFIDELKQYRSEDVVLNVGIGNQESDDMVFYVVNNVDLSSFDKSSIEDAQKESPWLEIVEEVHVPMMKINQVIEQYCKGTPTIVSLDTEGLELGILKTLDFEKYRPFVFIIETISYSANIQLEQKRKDIINYMKEMGYGEFAFTGVNSIFVDKKQLV